MLNMESPQMYDTVQTLSQLDLKKPPTSAVIGQITLTAMANITNNNGNGGLHHTGGAGGGTTPSVPNTNGNSGLVVKQQQSAHHMQQAAAANNNNNTSTANNNNNNNNNSNNNNNNSILQKHIMQQYNATDLDELTAQEISLDLQHLIDDNFRESEFGLLNDMVAATSPNTLNNTLQTNGVVAAKVLQMQQQQQQHLNRQQQTNYDRNNLLAYTPQAVHSNATYASNNSSDDNSSLASDTSTIKEEPIDPQEYRRQFQEVANNGFMNVGSNNVNGLYGLNSYGSNGSTTNGFNALTNAAAAGVLHHQNLTHLNGSHLAAQLKHHKGSLSQMRKQQPKSVDKGTEEYRRRRERNNIAVRKSREKAKVRSREVEEKVKTLLKEKDQLIRRLEEMNTEMQLHQQIYIQLMNHANPEISRICGSLFNVNNRGN